MDWSWLLVEAGRQEGMEAPAGMIALGVVRMDLGSILQEVPTGFADELEVSSQRQRFGFSCEKKMCQPACLLQSGEIWPAFSAAPLR